MWKGKPSEERCISCRRVSRLYRYVEVPADVGERGLEVPRGLAVESGGFGIVGGGARSLR